MNRVDLQLLAEARLADAYVLLDGQRWAAAYYLLGYAVECGLKACAARQFRQDEVPDNIVVRDFYTHRIEKLLGISGVKAALEARANSERAFQTNWNTVCDWNETSRYDHLISEAKARDMLLAVADPKAGVGMAEDAMVKEQLTDAMIDAGAKLTSRLDETGLPVTAAFWLFVPDLNEWRLLFASPEVSSKGPRMVYEKIGRAVDELGAEAPSVPLSIVRLLDADADLPRLLKTAVRTGPGISRVRFSKDVVDGHFIEDALIYRAA